MSLVLQTHDVLDTDVIEAQTELIRNEILENEINIPCFELREIH